jgi:hypothetical protein
VLTVSASQQHLAWATAAVRSANTQPARWGASAIKPTHDRGFAYVIECHRRTLWHQHRHSHVFAMAGRHGLGDTQTRVVGDAPCRVAGCS